MALSFEEFRTTLLSPEGRQTLGIQLSDAEAQQVYADPQASQSWFEYWYATNQPAAPAPAAAPAAQTVPLGGHDFTQTAAYGEAPATFGAAPGAYAATASDAPAKKRRTGLWVTLSILGALVLIAGVVLTLAFTTARHWTKVDVAEKPETFHTEEYETGAFNVSSDSTNPCFVDQDWTECTDAMAAQYAAACADVELTPSATIICTRYSLAIEQMRAEDQEGYVVASLGSFGQLTRTPETATREVSNDDYEPAVTHEAVCYFEFLGECE